MEENIYPIGKKLVFAGNHRRFSTESEEKREKELLGLKGRINGKSN